MQMVFRHQCRLELINSVLFLLGATGFGFVVGSMAQPEYTELIFFCYFCLVVSVIVVTRNVLTSIQSQKLRRLEVTADRLTGYDRHGNVCLDCAWDDLLTMETGFSADDWWFVLKTKKGDFNLGELGPKRELVHVLESYFKSRGLTYSKPSSLLYYWL